ncbi:MFS transporter [Chloroflexota bacterium]
MSTGVRTKAKPRIFYGWWIVTAGFAIVIYGICTRDYMSNQLPDLVKQLGGGASQMGMAMGISGLAGSISLLAIGPLIDRFGPRKLMLLGIPLTGIGFLWLSFVNSILTFSILQGTLVAIGMSAGFLLPVQTATANWFMKRRSIALAVICMASVLGEGLIDILGERIAGQFSWQSTFLGLGAVMLVIGIPLALVIRHRPEQYGYLPDGELSVTEETSEPMSEQYHHLTEINFTLRQALKTRTFWTLTIAMALTSGIGTIATWYMVPFLIDQGFSQATSVNVFNNTTLMGLMGIFLFGYLGDTFPKRYLLAIAVALQSASVVILMTAGSIAQVYLYMLVYGLGSGIVPLILAIRADYFGRKAFATITVVMMFISGIIGSPVSALMPVLVGWIFDITRNYQFAFLLSMLIGFVPATVFFFARPPKPPQQVFTPTKS